MSARGAALAIGLSLLALVLLAACARIAGPEGWAAPVEVDGKVLAALERSKLSLIDLETSQEIWRFPSESEEDKDIELEALYGTPVVGDGRAYLGTFTGTFYALDLETGKVLWQEETGDAIIGGAALVDGTVYVGSSDNRLYALDAETGASRWPPFEASGDIWSTPLVEAGTVYVTSMDKRVYALDAATGQPRWSQPFKADGALPSTPVLAGDRLYVGGLDNRLYALDAATGELVWSFEAKNWIWCQPLVADGVLYVGSLDHRLYALDAATGKPQWSSPFRAEGPIRARPALAAGVLMVADREGNVYGLDPATGKESWSAVVLESGILANPLVVGNEVFLSARNGELLRVDAETGGLGRVAAAP